jgi:hypothetical protein
VWAQVETLLRGQLPRALVNQAVSPDLEVSPAAGLSGDADVLGAHAAVARKP